MHPYEQALVDQNELLRALTSIDPKRRDFELEFDKIAAELLLKTMELDKMAKQDPSLTRRYGW